jgi:hypothetical protein
MSLVLLLPGIEPAFGLFFLYSRLVPLRPQQQATALLLRLPQILLLLLLLSKKPHLYSFITALHLRPTISSYIDAHHVWSIERAVRHRQR